MGNPMFLFMMLALLAMMWFTSSRQRKAQRERQAQLDALAPGSHVMTTSGLHAQVMDIDTEADTVVLDAGHGPMRWSRSAIAKQLDTPFAPIAAATGLTAGLGATMLSSAPSGATIDTHNIDTEVDMPEYGQPGYEQQPEIIDATPWVETDGADVAGGAFEATDADGAFETPVNEDIDYVEGNEHLEAPPLRRRESLEEAAAQGPLDWPDDGSKAKHQGYIDHDGDWQLRHNAPVEEEHHGRDGIADDDISLAIAEEMNQRGNGVI